MSQSESDTSLAAAIAAAVVQQVTSTLKGLSQSISGLRIEILDLRKNEHWRHRVIQILVPVILAVVASLFLLLEAILPWGLIYQHSIAQSRQIVGGISAQTINSQHEVSDRQCLGLATNTLITGNPDLKARFDQLCPNGEAPEVPAAIQAALKPRPLPNQNAQWAEHIGTLVVGFGGTVIFLMKRKPRKEYSGN